MEALSAYTGMAMLLSLTYDDICYVHLLSYLVEFLLEIPHLEQKAYPLGA